MAAIGDRQRSCRFSLSPFVGFVTYRHLQKPICFRFWKSLILGGYDGGANGRDGNRFARHVFLQCWICTNLAREKRDNQRQDWYLGILPGFVRRARWRWSKRRTIAATFVASIKKSATTFHVGWGDTLPRWCILPPRVMLFTPELDLVLMKL